ncbi:Type II/IV secretion system protein TadC, associated with Flp pilus assembly [hydrothermal vent metagenome]|uniref:Type II/IV secretion system protein TadC, associated with Flp pilus assembly n=1 Tax=hydrothermal vent metagenome TaxID=652676 RepID=A0A3B1A5Z2_9ZZZZ
MSIMETLFLYSTGFAVAGSLLTLMIAGYVFNSVIPEEQREFMDPLPTWLKLCWPLVRIFAYYIGSNYSVESLSKLDARLQKTGVGYLMNAEEFIGVRIVSALFQMFAAILVMDLLQDHNIIWPLLGLAFGYYFPEIWLNDTRKKREKEVIRALPVFLDFISMSVEAGLNFTGALTQAMDKVPKGALYNEFSIVMRDVRAGFSRADALQRMSDRLGIKDVTIFIRAIITAERLGSSMKKTLKVQSEQRRNERFQRAEKMAMEAPVKLIAPLIMFIFPVTFIVLGFPIFMKFMGEGLL